MVADEEAGRVAVRIRVARMLEAPDVIDVPSDLFILRGVLRTVALTMDLRSDNGAGFTARSVREQGPPR